MKTYPIILTLILSGLAGIGLVIVLYISSEEEIHRNNSFQRRYPHHPVTRENSFDLNFNSYYFAGASKDSIYLGNHTAPLHLLAIDKNLSDSSHHNIHLEKMEQFSFSSVKIFIRPPYYYLADGTVPLLYRGKLGNTNAAKVMSHEEVYFSEIVQLDSMAFAIRARSSITNQNELGLVELTKKSKVSLKPELLEKQIDGIFDVDGFLLYNQSLRKAIYVYRYRNEFLLMDNNLNLEYRGKTIDTIGLAQLDIRKIHSKNQKKLGASSTRVQLNATTSGKYLFTQSNRLGKFEEEKMIDQADIIDVYNLKKNTYEFSFYLYHFQQEKMREFLVSDATLYSLHGEHLVKNAMNSRSFDFKNYKKIPAGIRGNVTDRKPELE
ncbi:MAG: hypothetical protein ACQEWD_04485 [Bacteroidota bacterium]